MVGFQVLRIQVKGEKVVEHRLKFEGTYIILTKSGKGYLISIFGTGSKPYFVEGSMQSALGLALYMAMEKGLISIETYHSGTNKSKEEMEAFISSFRSLGKISEVEGKKGHYFTEGLY